MEASRIKRTVWGILVGVLLGYLIAQYIVRSRDPKSSDLPIACFIGDTERIRELLDLGHSVNMRDPEHGMTPLHFAMAGEQKEAEELLRSHGADDSLKDNFAVTPARAQEIMRDRKSRQLVPAVDSPWGVHSAACVYLIALGQHPDHWVFRGFRNAFAIGDGSIIVTAAHVVDDLVDAGSEGILFRPLIASAFLGEIVEADIVARDPETDIAVLRAPWQHPALRLGDGDASAAHTMIVLGYPRPEQVFPHGARHPSQAYLEELPLLRFDADAGKRSIALGGSRYVGPGWSGSPILFADSGDLAGVFGNRRFFQVGDDFVFHDPLGASVQSVKRLLKKHGIDLASPGEAVHRPHESDRAFGLLLDLVDAFTSDRTAEDEIIEQLVKLRPDSSIVHLLAAETFAFRLKDDDAYRQMFDLHLEKARFSDPSSVLIRASYGKRLFVQERYEEALTELDHLLKDYPENRFCQLLRLRTLEKSNRKTAAAYGASIAAVMEQNSSYWYTMGRVHQELEQHDLAIKAVRRAFAIDRKRGVLAWTLAQAGRLDEAEEQYRSNLAEHDCQWCWFHFAKFLVERRPDRRTDALDAIEKAASRAGQQLISDEEFESLRERVNLGHDNSSSATAR